MVVGAILGFAVLVDVHVVIRATIVVVVLVVVGTTMAVVVGAIDGVDLWLLGLH